MFDPTNPRTINQPRDLAFDQVTTSLTLTTLMQEDAPPIHWTVTEAGDQIRGHAHLFNEDDQARRRALSAWQRVIGAGPVTTNRMGATDQLTITGTYEGIPVQVSTFVDLTPGCCEGCAGHQEVAA